MLQLCFNESVAGALKFAMSIKPGGEDGATAIGFIGDISDVSIPAELERINADMNRRKADAIPLGGDPGEALALPMYLSIGDIRAPLSRECPRKEVVRRMIGRNYYGAANFINDADEVWRDCLGAVERIKSHCGRVRIWCDFAPDSGAGLLFAAALLDGSDAEVSVVPPPCPRDRGDGEVERFSGWGEVYPESFGREAGREILLDKPVLHMLAERWRELQAENAPLRAFINGRLTGVGEDFYDGFILNALGDETLKAPALVGRVVGGARLGVCDRLICERILAMSETGKLVLERGDGFYDSVVKRAQKRL